MWPFKKKQNRFDELVESYCIKEKEISDSYKTIEPIIKRAAQKRIKYDENNCDTGVFEVNLEEYNLIAEHLYLVFGNTKAPVVLLGMKIMELRYIP